MNNKNWLLFMAITASLFFIACTKETTVVQPADPTLAKAFFSPWTQLNMTGSRLSTGDSIYSQNIKADSLTRKVIDSGMFLSYLRVPTQGGTNSVVSTSVLATEILTVGNIQLISDFNLNTTQFRYVIIQHGIKGGRLSSGASVYTKEQLRAMSYEEVMKLLGKNP